MEKILLPLFYLPPVTWFSEYLAEGTEPILEKWENLPKQTYRNRCNIYGANGKLTLSIPLMHSGGRLYKDTKISYEENWRKIHWKSIKNAYQSSPYFEFYEDRLSKIYEGDFELLFDFNLNALSILNAILKVERPVVLTERYESVILYTDFRDKFNAKNKEPRGLPEYYQTFTNAGFLEDLSIIDLLCNLGPQALNYLKKIKL